MCARLFAITLHDAVSSWFSPRCNDSKSWPN